MTSKFRTAALIEAVTFLVLMGASVVKRALEGPNFVPVIGPIHGIAFLAYLVVTLLVREEQGWDAKQTIIVLVASAVPFGAILVNSRMVHEPQSTAA